MGRFLYSGSLPSNDESLIDPQSLVPPTFSSCPSPLDGLVRRDESKIPPLERLLSFIVPALWAGQKTLLLSGVRTFLGVCGTFLFVLVIQVVRVECAERVLWSFWRCNFHMWFKLPTKKGVQTLQNLISFSDQSEFASQ